MVNTHCHIDHMGGKALLARIYGCPVAVPLIRKWDTRALWLDYADQRAEQFAVSAEVLAGSKQCWGELCWKALAAPRHDMGALMFYCEQEKLLISGDALWESGFGVVLPDQSGALAVARNTLDHIAALNVALVIPGTASPSRILPPLWIAATGA